MEHSRRALLHILLGDYSSDAETATATDEPVRKNRRRFKCPIANASAATSPRSPSGSSSVCSPEQPCSSTAPTRSSPKGRTAITSPKPKKRTSARSAATPQNASGSKTPGQTRSAPDTAAKIYVSASGHAKRASNLLSTTNVEN